MKIKLFNLLILLGVFTFIIFAGCGGDDGVITPTTISDSNPDNNTTEQFGSIHIKVIWPQDGVDGKFIISSEDECSNFSASSWTLSQDIPKV